MERTVLHCDMNNFYASVECLYDPSLRGKAVAVAGDAQQRHGIVLAKNYEAKRFGIQTGDPLWLARQKCAKIVFVPPHYDRYLRFSEIARDIYGEYTDQVEAFGLDECWLDVSGSLGLCGSGKAVADELRERIKTELGVTISVGVSFNKVFAKLGSDLKKPDAVTLIERDSFRETVWPLPVKDLLYVGKSTQAKLKRYAIFTIGDLARSNERVLRGSLGKIGTMLWQFANGLDRSPVSSIGTQSMIKTIGNSTTAPRDLETDQDVRLTLYVLCESVAERLREHGFLARTVQIALRDNVLESFQRQGKLPAPSCSSQTLFDTAFHLFAEHRPDRPLRSIGVRACDLIPAGPVQFSLLPELVQMHKWEQLERTVDDIRRRYGHFSIQRGVCLCDPSLSSLDPKNDHTIHPVGFLTPGVQ